MEPSPAAAECAVRKIRAGRVEAEELVEDDLELVFSEGGLHIFNVVDVHQSFFPPPP